MHAALREWVRKKGLAIKEMAHCGLKGHGKASIIFTVETSLVLAETKCEGLRFFGAKGMGFESSRWVRLEFEGTPVYVREDPPDWFVPNRSADQALKALLQGKALNGDFHLQRLLNRVDTGPVKDYQGRVQALKLNRLREVWFHVTDRCNLLCSHCLVSSGPAERREMAADRIEWIAGQAHGLGARLFALTGGEPFMHGEIRDIIEGLLALDGTNVVILTNGTLLAHHQRDLRNWPRDRVHLQVSLDGLEETHDRIRGRGTFGRLMAALEWLKAAEIPYTISMCVIRENFQEMEDVVDLAARIGAGNVHFMWGFGRGRAKGTGTVEPEAAFHQMRRASDKARRVGMSIDNIETLRAQVFAPVGTRYDGSVAGWESIAVGPDGKVYPTPATVGIQALGCEVNGNFSEVWLENPVLERLRQTTVRSLDMPLRYFLGGGDFDHSYVFSGELAGGDPYYPLYLKTFLWLIAQEAASQRDGGPPALRLKMGEVLESCGPHGAVALVHNNCLLSVADAKGHRPVASFYADAARTPNEEILNPAQYPEALVDHISEEHLVRRYGCGSPVLDARLKAGESVLDLGCGGGVECYIAARLVGKQGKVVGLDMLGEMLSLAGRGRASVGKELGYLNVAFCGGTLEDLPLVTETIDVVISNCVINLSVNKRKVFREIRRVLKRGGRVVISDVVCETEPGPEIRNDDILKGQCLAGAMVQQDLFGLVEESGLISARVLGRFPYRNVKGHPFYSLTFEAYKPRMAGRVKVMYRGPHASVVTHHGTVLNAGVVQEVWRDEVQGGGDDILELDENGVVLNPGVMSGCACSCEVVPASDVSKEGGAVLSATMGNAHPDHDARIGKGQRHPVDCMVCGAPLAYTTSEVKRICAICGTVGSSNACCANDHYVCDDCHKAEAQTLVERICLSSSETDMIALMKAIRSHAFFPVHGPEHHGMVAGVVLSAYRNLGGKVTDDAISLGIQRGGRVSGGACAFMGACGGALGVGIAFGLILESSPVKAEARQMVQEVTKEALAKIASFKAARCCQRDTWLGLRTAAELSGQYLPISLPRKPRLNAPSLRRTENASARSARFTRAAGSVEQDSGAPESA